ncbi:hypothetical protein [Rhizobium sp. No.120]
MSTAKYYRIIRSVPYATMLLLFSAQASFADSATHQLSLVTSSIEGDCGGGTCTPMCSFKAQLKNIGHRTSRPIAIYLHYPLDDLGKKTDVAGGDEEDVAEHRSMVALYFRELKAGATDNIRDEARRKTCEELVIDKIEVTCPEEKDGKCPGFYYIEIPEVKVPSIKHQKIEGK